MTTFTNTRTFIVEDCITCGVEFGLPDHLRNRRLDDHRNFFCPNGHQQHYTGKTEAQKLNEQLDRERRTKQWLREERDAARDLAVHERNRANGYKGAFTKTKKRVGRGVCPACNRHFADLEQHVAAKHPTFGGDHVDH